MKVFERAAELSSFRAKNAIEEMAFIPTMGALHEGHLSLVRAAQSRGLKTAVSIFVNPLQFNSSEDLKNYPRTIETDLKLLERQGVDFVYLPSINEIYSSTVSDVLVDLGDLENRFEGAFRPGHFHGVIQVVYRLFKCMQPQVVFFGEKDLQQCLVVQCLIEQVFPAIEMVRVATTRETSGLAMSSRNARLSADGLLTASEAIKSIALVATNKLDFAGQIRHEKHRLVLLGFAVEYLSCIALPQMNLIPDDYFVRYLKVSGSHAVVFAGTIEGVRLIDNQVF